MGNLKLNERDTNYTIRGIFYPFYEHLLKYL